MAAFLAEMTVIFFTFLDIQRVCRTAPRTWHFCRKELVVNHELLKQIVAKRVVQVVSPFETDLRESFRRRDEKPQTDKP